MKKGWVGGSQVQRWKIGEKEEKKKLNHCRIVTITNFYIILHSFFVRLVFVFKDLNMIHEPLGVLFIILCIFIYFSYYRWSFFFKSKF